MECEKKTFNSALEASVRAGEINSENAKAKKKKRILRSYKCKECSGWHLTSMGKHLYRYHNSPVYRDNFNTDAFIKKEAEHWNSYFGIE